MARGVVAIRRQVVEEAAAAAATAITYVSKTKELDAILDNIDGGTINIKKLKERFAVIYNVDHTTVADEYANLHESLSSVIDSSLGIYVEHLRLRDNQIRETLNEFDKCDTVHAGAISTLLDSIALKGNFSSKILQMFQTRGVARLMLLVRLKAGFELCSCVDVILDKRGDFVKILFASKDRLVRLEDGKLTVSFDKLNDGHSRVSLLSFLKRKRDGEQMVSSERIAEIEAFRTTKSIKQLGAIVTRGRTRPTVANNALKIKVNQLKKDKNEDELIKMIIEIEGGTTYPELFKRVVCSGGEQYILNTWSKTDYIWKSIDGKSSNFYSKTNNRRSTINCLLHWLNLHPDNVGVDLPLSYFQGNFTTLSQQFVHSP